MSSIDPLLPGEHDAAVDEAKRAQRKHEPDLRRLGAFGTIGIGLGPEQPTWRQWWARCLMGRERHLPTPLLADGYGSAEDAMAALVELASLPRLGPMTLLDAALVVAVLAALLLIVATLGSGWWERS